MVINAVTAGTVISSRRIDTNNFHHIGVCHSHVVATCNPVFRAEVIITQDLRGQLWDNIIQVSDTIIATHIFTGDKVSQVEITNTRLAIVILEAVSFIA